MAGRCLLFFALVCACWLALAVQDQSQLQREALLQLYDAVGGNTTALAWNASSADYCSEFPGVLCCREIPAYLQSTCSFQGSVAALKLSQAGLVGTLPSALWAALGDLQELDVSGNTGGQGRRKHAHCRGAPIDLYVYTGGRERMLGWFQGGLACRNDCAVLGRGGRWCTHASP